MLKKFTVFDKLRFNGYIQPFEHVFFLFLQFLLAVQHRLSGKHTLLQKWKKPLSTSTLGSLAMWPRFLKALMIWSRTGLFAGRSLMRFCWIWILQRYEWMESFKYKIVYGVTDLICIEGKLTTGSQPSQSQPTKVPIIHIMAFLDFHMWLLWPTPPQPLCHCERLDEVHPGPIFILPLQTHFL